MSNPILCVCVFISLYSTQTFSRFSLNCVGWSLLWGFGATVGRCWNEIPKGESQLPEERSFQPVGGDPK